MKIYTLKIKKPEWFYDPPTQKQLKVLEFFEIPVAEELNRGIAGGIVDRILRTGGNREAWKKSKWSGPNKNIAAELLKEGSLFDDPVPEIIFPGRNFIFTGTFESGTRKQCVTVAEKMGAHTSSGTDYLVVGSKGCANWGEGSFGRKMESAMLKRMEYGHPKIICESDWLKAVQG